VTVTARIIIHERPTDGLVDLTYLDPVLDTYSGRALWSRMTLRKQTTCAVTGVPLAPGDEAYRPVGNQMYRARDGEVE
jgi:hypothetical protein